MASTPIIFPNASLDAVAVINSNFEQVFPEARPLRARPRQSAKLMDHPVESGQTNSDYKIVNPIEIELPVIVSSQYYRDVYSQIVQLYNDSELLTVQTRASNFTNMVITALPHEEDPEKYDVITINLQFREIQINTQNSNFAPANPVDANTQSLGEQAPGSTRTVTTNDGIEITGIAAAPESNPAIPVPSSGNVFSSSTAPITGDQATVIQQSMRN